MAFIWNAFSPSAFCYVFSCDNDATSDPGCGGGKRAATIAACRSNVSTESDPWPPKVAGASNFGQRLTNKPAGAVELIAAALP